MSELESNFFANEHLFSILSSMPNLSNLRSIDLNIEKQSEFDIINKNNSWGIGKDYKNEFMNASEKLTEEAIFFLFDTITKCISLENLSLNLCRFYSQAALFPMLFRISKQNRKFSKRCLDHILDSLKKWKGLKKLELNLTKSFQFVFISV